MAHIRKTGARWQARYRDPAGREVAKRFDRKVDAERWLTARAAEMLDGSYIDPAASRVTLTAYAAEWLTRMRPTWRATTAAGVENSLATHILPVIGARPLSTIRRSDVEALCAALPLAASTVRTVHQHLGQVLAAAQDDGLIVRNPASGARLPKLDAVKPEPVSLETAELVAQALPPWLAVAVPLGIGAGLRQSEATGLTVDRLDFLRRTLRVDRQLVSRHVPSPTLGPPKTAGSHRTIPMADFLLDALADHLRRFPAEGGELVLRSPAGAPLDSDRFGHQWRRACRAAGAPTLRYHALRHTFASTLLSRGVSVKAVAVWLGHANPSITLSTYAHLMPADEAVARSVLDAALNPSPDQEATGLGGAVAK